ncbi:MAG TPA: hypothetical protein VMA73_12590 [Streptosporangiaceae bacterium]|nr:hypothetical protein [Streptosporangiaceae bacterium]
MPTARTGTAGQVARENGTVRVMLSCRHVEDFARSSTDGLIAGASDPPP